MATSKQPDPATRRPYHHGNLRRALLDEALATIRARRRGWTDPARDRRPGGRLAHRALPALRRQARAAHGGGDRRVPRRCGSSCVSRLGGRRPRGRGILRDGCGVRSLRRRQPGALSGDVRRLRRSARCGTPSWRSRGRAPSRRWWTRWPRCSETASSGTTIRVLMARYVWALVHGVAMLGIDGQLREPGAVEELMRYGFERLRTGIGRDGPPPR